MGRKRLNPSFKTVFITGGSRGIGAAICKEISPRYNIIAPSRAELDLSSVDSIKNYIGQHKDDPIDILINNAGINPTTPFFEMDQSVMSEMMLVNVTAPLLLIQGLTSHMKEKKWGRILNLSSIWGTTGRANRLVYSTAKHAINGITRSLADLLGPFNIVVNSVCPGFVDTEMTRRNLSPKVIAELLKRVPLGRLIQPEEIAKAAAWLISNENTSYTGQLFVIDGGFSAY